jgi:hypothetical protein
MPRIAAATPGISHEDEGRRGRDWGWTEGFRAWDSPAETGGGGEWVIVVTVQGGVAPFG